MISLTRRQTLILAIVLIVLVLLTLVVAPRSGSDRQHGSTYSRAPQGYGAWYTFMTERGTPIQRWQKPLEVLLNPAGEQAKAYQSPDGTSASPTNPITLIRIADDLPWFYPNHPWIKQGNVLILLGVKPAVTDAPFTSDLPSPAGAIRIDTRRRQTIDNTNNKSELEPVSLLTDRFGSVVWQETAGKGRVIYVSTPYLAANAYQDFRPNFEWFAKLATETGLPLWVDEYLHGYRDAPTDPTAATDENLLSYLLKTPLSLLTMQAIVILLVAIWGQRRRFGPPAMVTDPVVNNSEAYIQAMAGILHKANCSEFVLETLSKAEQLEIQKKLGLGATLLPKDTVLEAWQRQTGHSIEDLSTVLQATKRHPQMSDPELQKWVETVQRVRQHNYV